MPKIVMLKMEILMFWYYIIELARFLQCTKLQGVHRDADKSKSLFKVEKIIGN